MIRKIIAVIRKKMADPSFVVEKGLYVIYSIWLLIAFGSSPWWQYLIMLVIGAVLSDQIGAFVGQIVENRHGRN